MYMIVWLVKFGVDWCFDGVVVGCCCRRYMISFCSHHMIKISHPSQSLLYNYINV